MTLPVLKHALFETKLPCSNKKIKYKGYTVKEEKILLIALQSNEMPDIINAIKQIITNCTMGQVDPGLIPIFDLEILLLLLRIVSTSNEVNLKFKDEEDEKIYEFDINLQDIVAKCGKDVVVPKRDIALNDEWGITMKHINIDMFLSNELADLDNPEKMYSVLGKCFEKIYSLKNEDEVYFLKDSTQEEIDTFIDSWDKVASENVSKYFQNLPQISHTIKYTNKKGTDREIILKGVNDFFL